MPNIAVSNCVYVHRILTVSLCALCNYSSFIDRETEVQRLQSLGDTWCRQKWYQDLTPDLHTLNRQQKKGSSSANLTHWSLKAHEMQMRLFQHNTIRLTMCALAFVNSPGQEGWGFPLWRSKHRQCSSTDGQQVFLCESGSPMARAWVRTAIEGFIVTQECTAPAALAGLVLRFSGHSFPLEDSPCTRAPPQTASIVVITLLSVLLIVRLNLEGGLFREFRTRSRAVLTPLCSVRRVGERTEVLVSADWSAPGHHRLPECTLLPPPAPVLKTDLLTCGPWTCGFPGSSTRDGALRKTYFSNASENLTLCTLPCGSMSKWGLVMRKSTAWGAEGTFG